ncbi:FecCD family ABC transporter permease [Paenibacillus terreus]|uniref:FecCD family ABC transporter permease n=1 Tax=Paenibacillus terreus TaxID=1387834 RepID=A0ABV5B8P4_9BACL
MDSSTTGKEEQLREQLWARPGAAMGIIVIGLAALLFIMALGIAVGAVRIPLRTVYQALFSFDPGNTNHQIIWDLRFPRVLAGALVGAAFAASGSIMQGMTRNPLADPGLLGINAGAAFALAICFAYLPHLSFNSIIIICFAGAGLGVALVFGLGRFSRGGLTPVRLALAGAAVSVLLTSLSQGIALMNNVAQDLDFWIAGGVAGTQWSQLVLTAPWIGAGLVASLLLSRYISILSLGEDVALGLGLRTGLIKLAASAVVMVLAGASVAMVGTIGFIGLVIPHVARFLVGKDYRWIIPTSAVLGSLLMVGADIAARLVKPPEETPTAAMIALIGVPYFLYLIRKEVRD